MSLPSLSKAYHFISNYSVTATGTALGTNRTIVKKFKDFLINTGESWVDATNASVTPTNMWSTRYSCDSVTAGSAGDGVDRWDSITDLVWAAAGVAHSWYVVRNTAIDTNCELLISCEGASGNGALLTIVLSPSAGFTGGTTTARPTATDEIVVLNGGTYGGVSNIDANVKLHVIKSTDGQCWRLFCANGGQINTAVIVEKAAALHSSWARQAVAYVQGATAATNVLTNALLNSAANFNARGASAMTMFLVSPASSGTQTNVTITAANDLSSEWPFIMQQLFSNTASNKGLHGYLNDIWYGSTTVASGSTAPTTGTQHQFVQLGSLIFPWCQVAFQIT